MKLSGFLTVEELAKLLKVTTNTVYTWLRAKKIPHIRVGKLYRFSSDEIENWIAKGCPAQDATLTDDPFDTAFDREK